MARKLKVFRTPIGFHDAYVAASSRKAALMAWGADVDLFARGAAEEVHDAGLMEEALSRPGEVIRKVRGTMEEHLAALPATPERAGKKPSNAARTASSNRKARARAKPTPRPSRAKLDAAELAINDAEQRYQAARRALADREAALRAERKALDAEQDRERKRLEEARDERDAEYTHAMQVWRASQA